MLAAQRLTQPRKFRSSLSLFFVLPIFSQQFRVGGRRNKNKNKIHSDHFPIELKSTETRYRRKHEIMFPSILIQLENGPTVFYFYFTN